MSDEQKRRLYRHGMRRGRAHRCRMCKTAWLFGQQVKKGVCTKCEHVANRRVKLGVEAKECSKVSAASWIGWPGELLVKFKAHKGQVVAVRIPFEEADAMIDLKTTLLVRYRALTGKPEDE